MIEITELNQVTVATITDASHRINTTADALDIMGNAQYSGADMIIAEQNHFHPDFFQLKTKLAGDILQKFATYGMRLAIIGDFTSVTSKSLNDFIYECNKGKQVLFLNSHDELVEKM